MLYRNILSTFAGMKSINILSTIIIAILLIACSETSLEEKAKGRVKSITEVIIESPNHLTIQDVKPIISNDSLCLLQYVVQTGEHESHKMEYYIVRDEQNLNEWYECAYIIEGHGSLMQSVAEYEEGMRKRLESNGVEPPKVNSNTTAFHLAHTVNVLLDSYRKVE